MPKQPAPPGAAADIVDKCAETPNRGFISVNDLSWILGIQPWSLQRLPRSFPGWVSLQVALTEVGTREVIDKPKQPALSGEEDSGEEDYG